MKASGQNWLGRHPKLTAIFAAVSANLMLSYGLAAQEQTSSAAKAPVGLFDGFFQVGYVTPDIDAALATYRNSLGVGQFWVFDTSIARPDDPHPNRIALAWNGDTMIELIEPGTGKEDPLYGDAVPQTGIAFHHTGHIVQDETRWNEILDRLAVADIPVTRRGKVGDKMEFMYVDARAYVGHYVEFVWLKDPAQSFFSQVPKN